MTFYSLNLWSVQAETQCQESVPSVDPGGDPSGDAGTLCWLLLLTAGYSMLVGTRSQESIPLYVDTLFRPVTSMLVLHAATLYQENIQELMPPILLLMLLDADT